MLGKLWVHQHAGEGAKEETPRSSWRRSSGEPEGREAKGIRRRRKPGRVDRKTQGSEAVSARAISGETWSRVPRAEGWMGVKRRTCRRPYPGLAKAWPEMETETKGGLASRSLQVKEGFYFKMG